MTPETFDRLVLLLHKQKANIQSLIPSGAGWESRARTHPNVPTATLDRFDTLMGELWEAATEAHLDSCTKIVWSRLGRRGESSLEYGDVLSMCGLALRAAILNYRPTPGKRNSFRAYAITCLYRSVLIELGRSLDSFSLSRDLARQSARGISVTGERLSIEAYIQEHDDNDAELLQDPE